MSWSPCRTCQQVNFLHNLLLNSICTARHAVCGGGSMRLMSICSMSCNCQLLTCFVTIVLLIMTALSSTLCFAVAGGGTYQSLRQGRINMLPTTNVVLVNLIRSLMSSNPADRPSPEKILSSSLFAKRAQKENKPQHGFGGLNLQPSRVA